MHFSSKIMFKCISTFIFCISIIKAESHFKHFDTLSGPLPALVKANKYPYIVISTIEVPPQKTVTIEPGTVFLFKNFSGLHVRGRLIARATPRSPILFTSEYDRNSNPNSKREANPFDWDGIYMTTDALGSQMSHCSIMYSVYALRSDTKLIRLNPVTFKDNGKGWITIEDEDVVVENNQEFNYILEKNDPLLQDIALDLVKDPLYSKRTSVRVISILGSLTGLALTGIYSYSWNISEKKLKTLSDENDFDNLNQNNGSTQWHNAHKGRKKNILLTGSGIAVTVLGVAGIKWSYSF